MVSGKRDDEGNLSDGSEYVPEAMTSPKKQEDASVLRYQKAEESAEESSTSTLPSASSRSSLRKYIRLKGCYNDNYRELLNTAISEASNIAVDDDLEVVNPMLNLPPFDLGGTSWTTDEKRIVFRAIARYGRDDLPRIASSLHNKSEQEVRAYLESVQKTILQDAREDPKVLKTARDEMPAAIEVSDECREQLDTCADALAWYQFTWEAKQEHKAHGEFWLLDRRLADEITVEFDLEEGEALASRRHLEIGDGLQDDPAESLSSSKTRRSMSSSESPDLVSPVPAAELLNLSKFIELSESVFMNSKDPDWNWRTFQDLGKPGKSHSKLNRAEQSPAIFRTAFDDFHRLTISLTKRIMHAALFQATSRLRAKDNIVRPFVSDPRVEKRDILAALEILNLEASAFKHWATLPRRHKVDWLYKTDTDNKSRTRQVSAAEAERYLQHEGRIDHSKVEELFQSDQDVGLRQPNSQNSDCESEYESFEDAPVTLDHDESADPYDQYLELLDMQASRAQEQQIWNLLGKDAPSSANLSGAVEAKIPKAIPTIEQGTSSFADWRAWTERRAKWEMDEGGTSEDEAMESEEEQSPVADGVSLSWISIPQTIPTREDESDPFIASAEQSASRDARKGRGWSAINSTNGSKRRRSEPTIDLTYDVDIPFGKRHEKHSPGEMEAAQRFLGDEPAWVTQDIPHSEDEQELDRSPSPAQSYGGVADPRLDDSE